MRHSAERLTSDRALPFSLSHRLSMIGPIGVCVYIIGFAFPFEWDIPFMILIAASILSAVFGSRDFTFAGPRLLLVLLTLFLVAMGLSIIVSDDIGMSLRLSASFLPALLIFFLITECFTNAYDIKLLYFSFSIVSLGLAIISLWIAWGNDFDFSSHRKANALVSWSPILISRNDLTFLSLIAPFSLVLVYQKFRSVIGIIAALAIALSVCAVVVFQSRGATLTMFVTTTCTAAFLKPRRSIAIGLVILTLFLVTDAWLEFPLFQRFSELSNNRHHHWILALSMFHDAPLLGHGPHTFGLYSKIPWPHSLYIEVLFGHGIIGLVTLGALLVYGASTAWKMRHTKANELRLYSASAFGAMIGFCISSVLELSFLRQWVVIVLFILLGIVIKLSSLHLKISHF